MATSGEKTWPRMGRNRWPLTRCEVRSATAKTTGASCEAELRGNELPSGAACAPFSRGSDRRPAFAPGGAPPSQVPSFGHIRPCQPTNHYY